MVKVESKKRGDKERVWWIVAQSVWQLEFHNRLCIIIHTNL